MPEKNEASKSLEQLLETLIKMVGRSNEHIDRLSKRVNHLEWQIQDLQVKAAEPHRQKEFLLTGRSTQSLNSKDAAAADPFNRVI